MPIIIDPAMSPIYFVTFQGVIDIPQTEDYLQRLFGLLSKQKIVTILKTENVQRTDRALVKFWASWLEANKELCAQKLLGGCFVLDSFVHRFVLSSLLLVVTMPMPYFIASDEDDAIKWSKETLQKNGVLLPIKS